jgi:hypothetical protein
MSSNSQVLDLDILRPKTRNVKIGGREFDLSFIPVGITYEIDALVRQVLTLNLKELGKNGEETKKGLDLSVKLCVCFLQFKDPTCSEAWFLANVSPAQTEKLATIIQETLQESYEGIQKYGKN